MAERPTIEIAPWMTQFVQDNVITRDEAARMLRWAWENVQVAATLYAACSMTESVNNNQPNRPFHVG